MRQLPASITNLLILIALSAALFVSPSAGTEAIARKSVTFATVEGRELKLDLYVPESPACLIVWVHGGRWWRGTRASYPDGLIAKGYALASVDYRLATEAVFPAQVHDIKASIRFLRAHADSFGYRPNPIVIAGASAGGHLAALVGTTNGERYYEGQVGNHLDRASSVQAIVDLYGPTNFLTILDQSTIHGYKVRAPALALLLGGDVEAVEDLARLASPVHQVDGSDPPLLIIHGDQDIQVPINQSHELIGVYDTHNRPAILKVVHGGGHGGMNTPAYLDEMNAFLSRLFK